MDRIKVAQDWQEALVNQEGFIKDMVQKCLQQAMGEAFNKFINAGPYERSEARNGQRNGHYERQLQTRVGNLTLQVCRDRAGEFSPEIFERYQRSEQALVLTLAQMYISGISTRKVNKIMYELCGSGISKSQVSVLVKQLDEQLSVWRNRRLDPQVFKYLMVDARYEKVRENRHVVSKAFVTVVGITDDGIREVIGFWVVNSESTEAWDACFQELKDRGLHGVEYVVSDENKGLRNALQKHFQGAQLQRCQVHYMRNFLDKLSKSERDEGARLLQDVFAATTREDARVRQVKLNEYLVSKKRDKVAGWLEETIEETLIVFELPPEHRKKMKSTNMLERLNQELKRRSRTVRIFPDENSCLRLLGHICQEVSESWMNTPYIKMNI